jgi:SAM-dependent methyltransferase
MCKTTEFPRNLLPLLRCVRDSGQLALRSELRRSAAGVTDGALRCIECRQEYSIEGGIARLMTDTTTQETAHEMELKDAVYEAMPDIFEAPSSSWRSKYSDSIEILPHLQELAPLDGCLVLELGCGDGRFTLLMAQLGAEILAVDFSGAALRKLARRLPSGIAPTTYQVVPRDSAKDLSGRVGLVQADASHFHAAPGSFDRALSATPLDSRHERMNMFRTVAESLKDDGRYVAGVEHDDLSRRIMGMPVARRYTPGGIYIEHFNIRQLRCELAPYFSRLHFRFIRAHIPFVKHLPTMLAVRLALAVIAIPLLRQLGTLLLASARDPIRPPLEGVRRPGIRTAQKFYRWYKRLKREEPMWDNDRV